MSITHVGKIGRLPKSIRDDLGRRIEDGEPGKELVIWLNGEPRVQEILKKQFGGRAITEQNLSEWKQCGHPDWLRQEQIRSLVAKLTEQAGDLADAADGMEISDRFASVMTAELIVVTRARLEKEADPEKRSRIICEVHRELCQLRRDDHRAVRTVIKRERWNRELEREQAEDLERQKQEGKKRLRGLCFSVLQQQILAKLFGGGKNGEKIAEYLHRIEFDLPLDDLFDPGPDGEINSEEIQPSQAESDPIQPNPDNF